MDRIHLSIRAQIASLSDASHACILAGRLLLAFIAILLPAMLWTEHLTTWDRFFQGGQDCELGILTLFAFLCLVILLSQRGQQSTALHLVLQRSLSLLAQNLRTGAVSVFVFISLVGSPPSGSSHPGMQALPLRI